MKRTGITISVILLVSLIEFVLKTESFLITYDGKESQNNKSSIVNDNNNDDSPLQNEELTNSTITESEEISDFEEDLIDKPNNFSSVLSEDIKLKPQKNIPKTVTVSIPQTTTYWTYAPLVPVKLSESMWLSGRPPRDREKICHLPADGGPCDISNSAWYYDKVTLKCQWFRYTGCMGNANRFASRILCQNFCINNIKDMCESVTCLNDFECIPKQDENCIEKVPDSQDPEKLCPPKQPICTFAGINITPNLNQKRWKQPAECLEAPDQGSCMKRTTPEKRYFYDKKTNDCSLFYFSGCGGGNNRFMEKSQCMNHCAV